MSSAWLDCCSSSSRPGTSATCIMSGCSCTRFMMRRQIASMSRKAWPSRGICFMISSAPKMGSRYSHLPWHLSHCSRMSCGGAHTHTHRASTREWRSGGEVALAVRGTGRSLWRTWKRTSLRSQGPSVSMKGLAKGEAVMAWLLTMWSSSRPCASSTGPPLRIKVPVSFQGASSKARPSQSVFIFSSAFSMDHSLDAWSLSSVMRCRCDAMSWSSSRLRLVTSSRLISKPTTSASACAQPTQRAQHASAQVTARSQQAALRVAKLERPQSAHQQRPAPASACP